MNLLDQWEKTEGLLRHKNIFLFLDYDGTLSPIVAKPQDAVLPPAAKKALADLAALSVCRIAVVSGRALADVAGRVALESIFYVGDHGFKMRGQGIVFDVEIPEKTRFALKALAATLQQRLAGFPGVVLQPKDLTLSCHYRLAREEDAKYIRRVFDETARSFVAEGAIRVFEGKKVFEARPTVDWDKGQAVLWLLENTTFGYRRPSVPIYIGDDVTDEDAFRALSGKGLSVWVGAQPNPNADYELKDTSEVLEFLSRLKALFAEDTGGEPF